MKSKWILFLPLVFLMNCVTPEEDHSQQTNDIEEVETEPVLTATDTVEASIQYYWDTLTFTGFDDNADYWYAYFETDQGESWVMITDEMQEDDMKHSIVKVKWKWDTFYEAGEGDAPYQQKKLVEMELLEKRGSFEEWLNDFAEDYFSENFDQQKYAHEKLKVSRAFNPGAYCNLGYTGEINDYREIKGNKAVVKAGFPKGDFCEGYAGVSSGIYFKEITEKQLPSYTVLSEEDDFIREKLLLPSAFKRSKINVGQVIDREYHYAYLYFLEIDGDWYLWVEDLCDCSA
ncbi:MAG: hypothetical protein WDZ35_15710 [Crocinitomicaceae bacterium]